MPRVLSFRTKSRFSNEKSWFAFLRKKVRMVRKMLVWMCVFDYSRPLDVFEAIFWWCSHLIIRVVVFIYTIGASNGHIPGRCNPTYSIENSRKHQNTPETSKGLGAETRGPGRPDSGPWALTLTLEKKWKNQLFGLFKHVFRSFRACPGVRSNSENLCPGVTSEKSGVCTFFGPAKKRP